MGYEKTEMNVGDSQAPADRTPCVDTPLKAAIRKAFDDPTIVNIEAVAQAARDEVGV